MLSNHEPPYEAIIRRVHTFFEYQFIDAPCFRIEPTIPVNNPAQSGNKYSEGWYFGCSIESTKVSNSNNSYYTDRASADTTLHMLKINYEIPEWRE